MISSLQLPTYPLELEAWWWQKALTKWSDHGEEKILNLLRREIVEQATIYKKRIFDSAAYGSRDLSILAYGNFYFPRTMVCNEPLSNGSTFLSLMEEIKKRADPNSRSGFGLRCEFFRSASISK